MTRFGLYTYNISKLDNVKKVKFVYALKGRGKDKGLVDRYYGVFLVNGCFMVPEKYDKEILHIFSLWTVPFTRKLIEVIE